MQHPTPHPPPDNHPDLAQLRAALLAVEEKYAAALLDAREILRTADPDVRKQVLEELRKSPERMTATVETLEEGIYMAEKGVGR